ncbi:MAG: hypothetical protein ACKORY_07500 [Actinomycetota bacterium]
MGQRLLHRRLAQVSARMREVQEELRVVEDQLAHLVDDADDKSLRAMVAETPHAQFEHHEARKHADAMGKHRDDLRITLAELGMKLDDLLDRLKENAQ